MKTKIIVGVRRSPLEVLRPRSPFQSSPFITKGINLYCETADYLVINGQHVQLVWLVTKDMISTCWTGRRRFRTEVAPFRRPYVRFRLEIYEKAICMISSPIFLNYARRWTISILNVSFQYRIMGFVLWSIGTSPPRVIEQDNGVELIVNRTRFPWKSRSVLRASWLFSPQESREKADKLL